MDLFRLGLRNLLGITVPGAILVLALAYCVLSATVPLGWPMIAAQAFREQGTVVWVTLFLISYVSGSLIRLRAADAVDSRSARKGPHDSEYPGPFPELKTIEDQLHQMFE